jgi:hypothetical protein
VRKRLCTQHHVAPSTQVDTIETAAKYASKDLGTLLFCLVLQLETIFLVKASFTSSKILSPTKPCCPSQHCRMKSTQESLNAFGDFTAFPTVGSNAKIESKKQEPLPGTEATCTRYRWHIASKYASSVKPPNDAPSGSLKTFIVAQTSNGFICHFKRASLCSKAATASGCAGPAQPPSAKCCQSGK